MNRPTRFYSNLQEKAVAKATQGKQVPNSGAGKFVKGDVLLDKWLIECKTATSEKQAFSIKQSWLEKNKAEAYEMKKNYNALCFDFGPKTDRYYIVDEKIFQLVLSLIGKEEENG